MTDTPTSSPTESPEAEPPSLQEVDSFLKEHQAAGVLIGGMMFMHALGASERAVEKRKDVDVLVLSKGNGIDYPGNFDLFLPSEAGPPKNRNDYSLPFHIHHLGDDLEPGLHLMPLDALRLVEAEMSVRRAAHRVMPGTVPVQRPQNGLPLLPLEDIVLEFPGEFSWFSGLDLPQSVQVHTSQTQTGGLRHFLSFLDRADDAFPQTAFPTESDVRTPIVVRNAEIPKVDLPDREIKTIGDELIKAGHIVEGMKLILERCPQLADSLPFIAESLEKSIYKSNTTQAAQAFIQWYHAARQHGFHSLVYLDCAHRLRGPHLGDTLREYSDPEGQFLTHIAQIADTILNDHGVLYLDLVLFMRAFAAGIAPPAFTVSDPAYDEVRLRLLCNFLAGDPGFDGTVPESPKDILNIVRAYFQSPSMTRAGWREDDPALSPSIDFSDLVDLAQACGFNEGERSNQVAALYKRIVEDFLPPYEEEAGYNTWTIRDIELFFEELFSFWSETGYEGIDYAGIVDALQSEFDGLNKYHNVRGAVLQAILQDHENMEELFDLPLLQSGDGEFTPALFKDVLRDNLTQAELREMVTCIGAHVSSPNDKFLEEFATVCGHESAEAMHANVLEITDSSYDDSEGTLERDAVKKSWNTFFDAILD